MTRHSPPPHCVVVVSGSNPPPLVVLTQDKKGADIGGLLPLDHELVSGEIARDCGM